MDLEGGEVLEKTAVVNQLAGINGGGKSKALLSDVSHQCFVSSGMCFNLRAKSSEFPM